jgi:DnaK suppressor protein
VSLHSPRGWVAITPEGRWRRLPPLAVSTVYELGVDDSDVRDVLGGEREATVVRLRAMTSEFEDIVAASVDANADDEHDPEGSTIAFERAQLAALISEARAYLDDLDRAVARLDTGTYGTCDRCGAQIAEERLAARPASLTCVRCATSSSP